MSDSEDDDAMPGVTMPGIAMPSFGGPPAEPDSDDDDEAPAAAAAEPAAEAEEEAEEEEEETATGLLSAEAAFDDDSIVGLEMNPFRRAAAAMQPEPEEPEEKGKGKKGARSRISSTKIFIGGLSFDTTDASLLKAASRYGKVQESTVVRTDGGKSRGFGFATFVSHKGANYIVKEAGDPPQIMIDGRMCTVRYSDEKVKATEGLHKLPARGNLPESKPPPRERKDAREMPGSSYGGSMDGEVGVGAMAAAHKRGARDADEDEAEHADRPKKARKKKEEIVTITRRQDAEPLDKKPITMRELFPKEFWRV